MPTRALPLALHANPAAHSAAWLHAAPGTAANTRLRVAAMNDDVADRSVFATSGGVDPTAALPSVALYIADAMKQRLDRRFE